MSSSKNKVGRSLTAGLLILAVIFLSGGSMGLYSMTCVDLWIPVIISLFTAAVSMILLGAPATFRGDGGEMTSFGRFWRWLFDSKNYLLCGAAQFLTVAVTVMFLFFFINFYGRDKNTSRSERVEIERVYREKHYHTRRVGRNRYVRGDSYYEHYVEIRLPDNRLKSLRINPSEVSRYQRMDSLCVELEKGAFGFTIFRKDKL